MRKFMKLKKIGARALILMFLAFATITVTNVAEIESHASDAMFDMFDEDTSGRDSMFGSLEGKMKVVFQDAYSLILVAIGGATFISFLIILATLAATGNATKRSEKINRILIIIGVVFVASNAMLFFRIVTDAANTIN